MVRSYRSVICFIIFILVFSTVCYTADKYTISGVVRDGSTKEPLACANILIQGTTTGTSTDAQGKFSLEIPPGHYTLRCSLVGYKASSTEILIQKNT
jgi:hypothetical protein